MQPNTLYYGDNLSILRDYIPDESVDLIYLDPPFNSNRSYNVLFKDESGHDSEAQITAFDDTWHWNMETERIYTELVTEGTQRVSSMIGALRQFIGMNQMGAYLVMMAARLVELHRVLKPTGSLYLHCDPTAVHYLKIVLDTIFGPDRFLNEVIWQRTAVKGDVRRKFGSVHDVILTYFKTNEYFFQSTYGRLDTEYYSRFKFDDNDGRGPYQSAPLDSPNPRPNLTYPYKGFPPPVKGWRVSSGVMEQLDKEGKLIFPPSTEGRIRRKVYLHEQQGPKITDVWADIPPLQATSAERLGYPTQKPQELLERIIQTSSKPGDLVLDPFCGCGTAVAAAETLGRRWIGIDITHLAISLIKYRMETAFPGIKVNIVGEPETISSARHLAMTDRYQFQWWALSLIRARPVGETSGKAGKKGADHGIDGVINFINDRKGTAKQVIVQVKSGKVQSAHIRDLIGTLDREKSPIGVFLTLEEPSREMVKEAAGAGFYRSELWNEEYPRVQILTIEQLLNGAKVQMPPQYGTFKGAKRQQREGDARQMGLLDAE